MEKQEAIKQAAVKLRDFASKNEELTKENEKIASEKEAVVKELKAYKTACQLVLDGDLDVGELTEKVASFMEKSETEVQRELQRCQLINGGFGQVKMANGSPDGTGESDPLTDFLHSLG